MLGRYSEALVAFDRAIQIQPDDSDAWYNRGYALNKLEKYEEALIAFDSIVKINTKDPGTWTDRGWALHNLERYSEAIASYDKALAIQPNYDLAIGNRNLAENKLRKRRFLKWIGLK